jgi:uncharacterized iron-regulated membrane protein
MQHSVLHWLQELHFNLLVGPNGLIVNAAGSVLLVFVCVTGIVIWWPGRRDWRRGFTIAWRARWQNINYDLHGVVGAATVLLLAAVAVAGVWVAFRDFSRYHPDEISWQAQVRTWPVDLDVVVDRAEAAAPGGTLTGLVLPQHSSAAFRVDKQFPERAVSVYVDQQTGRVLRMNDAPDTSLWTWTDTWMSAIHYGRFAGYTSRAIWFVLGVAPAVLLVSGVLMWWNRVLSKKLRPRRQDSPAVVRSATG